MANIEFGTTWWGKKWLDALSGIDYANRIPRGKDYAVSGRVYSLNIDERHGVIKARVRGNYDPFYAVKIKVPQLDPKKTQKLIKAIAESPVIIAKLANRELAPEVFDLAESLNIKIFPERWDDLDLSCSCPDIAVPCKHIAAVIYKISQEIDANPFVLFTLRGVDIIEELEKYGIHLEEAETSEMPLWQSLLKAYDPSPKADISLLNKLSYVNFDDITDSLLGLFSDSPAGYTEGKLKDILTKTVKKAQQLAVKQFNDKTDRDLPTYDVLRPLLSVNSWGMSRFNSDFSWMIHPNDGNPYQVHIDEDEDVFPYEMFSCSIPAKEFEESSEEIEALYQVWLIANKIVQSGAIMPQIFEPVADCFAIRWIPAVISPQVQNVTQKIGQSLLSLPEKTIDIERAPEKIGATALGQIVLSAFIQSYIKKAYKEILNGKIENNPDRASLFLGRFIDTEEFLTGPAVKLRLEAWLSPLYLENLDVKPVIVLSDKSFGLENTLTDIVEESRISQDSLGGILTDEEANKSSYYQEYVNEEIAKQNESIFDGSGHIDDVELEDESNDKVTDDTDRDLFSNDAGVGIEMGFKLVGDDEETFISLNEILTDRVYSNIRFECMRTVSRLSSICPVLTDLLSNHGGNGTISIDNLASVILSSVPAMKLLGVELIIPKNLQKILYPKTSITLKTQEQWEEGSGFVGLTELLDFDWQLAIGNQKISEKEFEKLCDKAGQFVRFKDSFVYVDPSEVKRIAKKLTLKQTKPSKQKLVVAALTGKFGDDNVLLSKELKKALDELLSEKSIAVPETLNAKLRPYQERGYSWLIRNIKTTMGSIIADDMGLGKTLQVIAALEKLRSDKALEEKGALVVVPTSLLTNWTREITKFAPLMTFKVFYGQNRALEPHTHITLTTYGVLRSQLKLFKAINWRVMIIDEAQAIKTHTSQIFKAVRMIKADSMIAMSGTPVENRLLEYWSIMDFVNPGLLGGVTTFKKEIANPIEKQHDAEAVDRFKRITAPFIMRRLKSDKSVISDLPDKLSYDKLCSLTKEQTALYTALVKKNMLQIKNGAMTKEARRAMVLNMILQLKQICNAPEQYLKNTPFKGPKYSGKAELMFDLLKNLLDARRKVIIFTQFKQMGIMLQSWIKDQFGFVPDFLHGAIGMKERGKMVDRFQNDRKSKVLILSLKAAGTGLNLTAASAVIHYDLWWNPAVEAQATDRAYRIGQKNNVEVFRLISANTFEEKINAILESKKELADLTVNTGESWIGDMSNRQLDELFSLSDSEKIEQNQVGL